jgi:hypothetical protein
LGVAAISANGEDHPAGAHFGGDADPVDFRQTDNKARRSFSGTRHRRQDHRRQLDPVRHWLYSDMSSSLTSVGNACDLSCPVC